MQRTDGSGDPRRAAELERFASVRVDPGEAGFAEPLRAAAGELAAALPPGARVVLLGSVATRRYLDPLLPALGDTLHFPAPFRGMGDMQRGALMLRAAASGEELAYARPDLPAPSRSSRRSPVPTRGTLAGGERS